MEDIKADGVTITEVVQEKPILEMSQVKQEDNDDIFISEKDTFSITVKYYKKDKDLIVQGVDDEFDISTPCKSFDVTFKYPSYSDSQSISAIAGVKMKNDLSITDLMALQDARIITIFRSWTISGGIDKIKEMNTKIVKAIRNILIEQIGMEGIL